MPGLHRRPAEEKIGAAGMASCNRSADAGLASRTDDAARIGVMKALHRNEERVFNPDRKDTNWGRKQAGTRSLTVLLRFQN
jgi:hypothetical protein